MLKSISIMRRRRDVIELTAPPTSSNLDERREIRQLAAEIRAQGSAADVAARCARAANVLPPRRPEPLED